MKFLPSYNHIKIGKGKSLKLDYLNQDLIQKFQNHNWRAVQ